MRYISVNPLLEQRKMKDQGTSNKQELWRPSNFYAFHFTFYFADYNKLFKIPNGIIIF